MLNDLQKRLLLMLEWIDGFTKKHGLKYYISGGTLLGAVRHKGFIPWDDDIDIALPRPDYEILLSLLKKPVDGYVIESPKNIGNDDFLYPFGKLYDTRTTMIEHLKKDIKRGVYIDVFPLDGMGSNPKEALKTFKKVDKKKNFLLGRICRIRKTRKFYKNLFAFCCRMIPPFLVNERKICRDLDKLFASKDFDNSLYVGNFAGAYHAKEIMRKDVFGEGKEYQFEGITVVGPSDYESYLTQIYGDWRQLPPVEKRQSAHDFIGLDLNKSYLDAQE